jgi:hypothetical protein
MSLGHDNGPSAGARFALAYERLAQQDAWRSLYLSQKCGVYTTPEARAYRKRQADLANEKRNEKRRARART